MIINVTALHIITGVGRSSEECPVALAVKEATGAFRVTVTLNDISIRQTINDIYESISTPDVARQFIARFDQQALHNPERYPGHFKSFFFFIYPHEKSTRYRTLEF